jgi:hypothetical protein
MKNNLIKEPLKIPAMVTLQAAMPVRNLPGFFIFGGVKMKKEVVDKIEMALYQIHALAKLSENEAMENPEPPSDYNALSDERLSLSQVIAEKAEFCLEAIGGNLAGKRGYKEVPA